MSAPLNIDKSIWKWKMAKTRIKSAGSEKQEREAPVPERGEESAPPYRCITIKGLKNLEVIDKLDCLFTKRIRGG